MRRRRGRTGKDEESAVKRFAFRQCPGCRYDFLTGEGTRECGWYDCPYLPEELKVFCPECNYDFATGEGNPCSDPPTCDWSIEGFEHAANAKRFFGSRS